MTTETDLPAGLKDFSKQLHDAHLGGSLLCFNAALEIERLRGELDDTLERYGKLQMTGQRLRTALETAYSHLNMTQLEISHCKDYAVIQAARGQST